MKIRAFVGVLVLGSSVALTAFGQSSASASCPMAVPGTMIVPKKVQGGAAIDFTTRDKAEVAELRQRVDETAARHNALQDLVPGHGLSGNASTPMNGAVASVQDIPSGARVVLTPQDPSQRKALQQHVETRAGVMSHERCAMIWEKPAK